MKGVARRKCQWAAAPSHTEEAVITADLHRAVTLAGLLVVRYIQNARAAMEQAFVLDVAENVDRGRILAITQVGMSSHG